MHKFTYKLLSISALIIFVIILVGLFPLFFLTNNKKYSCATPIVMDEKSVSLSLLRVGSTSLAVELADTVQERQRGLSRRSNLEPMKGMLFVFDHPDTYEFWMPDMCFPIDIIWVNSEWRIVDIATNVTPASYPTLFTPKEPALYVLEVVAGTANRFGWERNTQVTFIPFLEK